MRENEILSLFFERSEEAIAACRRQYGTCCRAIAKRILGSDDSAEEAENDAYLAAWNSIPPERPKSLAAFLFALTRRRAVDMLRSKTRQKRGGGEWMAALEELEECVPSPVTTEDEAERALLREAIDRFLVALHERTRIVFMQRYWWLRSSREIAGELGMSESAVRMQLKRTREKLKEYLEKEGFEI